MINLLKPLIIPLETMMRRLARTFGLVMLMLPLTTAVAQTTTNIPAPAQSLLWKGYQLQKLQVEGRPALLASPKTPAPGNPWIWRTEFWEHRPEADVALLAKGWHVAYVQVSDMYGSPAAVELMEQFYKSMTQDHGLNKRTVLEGFSRGGLYAVNFAATHPDQVAALYLDAPVLDLRSWPGGKCAGKGDPKCWEQVKQIYGLTEQTSASFKGNPLDHLEPLAKEGIPIIVVCGDADTIVPMPENTSILESRYKSLGGTIRVIVKPGCDHHPHSLDNPKPIVDFLIEHTRESKGTHSSVSDAPSITPLTSQTPVATPAP